MSEKDSGTQQQIPDGRWMPGEPVPYPETWLERIRRFLGLPTWDTPAGEGGEDE